MWRCCGPGMSVMVRIFGRGTERIIERDTELSVSVQFFLLEAHMHVIVGIAVPWGTWCSSSSVWYVQQWLCFRLRSRRYLKSSALATFILLLLIQEQYWHSLQKKSLPTWHTCTNLMQQWSLALLLQQYGENSHLG